MMNKLEQPLYPKISSIYNKILQLISAILLIVILMVFLVANTEKSEQAVEQHFEQVAEKFLQQSVAGISALLDEETQTSSKKSQDALLQSYLNNLASADFIKQVHLYDNTGMLLLTSEASGEASATIKLLYGLDESVQTLNKSKQYVPFIKEIRNDSLTGYLRLTIEKSYLTAELSRNSEESQAFSRLLLLISGIIGFLLTRGLNRFSRQGFRAPSFNSLTKK